MLQRIWSGFVGGVAGIAVGLAIAIAIRQFGIALDTAGSLRIMWISGAVGLVVCFLIGGKRGNGKPNKSA